jgi:DNA-binding NarL/FixJ family response regulator
MRRRVLLVDDHPGFRRVTRMMLEFGDFDVVGEADSCAAARVQAAQVPADVALLDVMLPDGDGVALAEELRLTRPAMAVVLVSSRTRAELGDRLVGSGARGFLHKSELTAAGFAALLR